MLTTVGTFFYGPLILVNIKLAAPLVLANLQFASMEYQDL